MHDILLDKAPFQKENTQNQRFAGILPYQPAPAIKQMQALLSESSALSDNYRAKGEPPAYSQNTDRQHR
ncbi:MAG: hypothetical protein LUC51_04100 [Cloacibacillus porcorum]|nr:hypothetical protein [Cloacibacillus porcorum]